MRQSVKELADYLKPVFKAAGYKKHSLTWTKEFDEVIHYFNIQVSQWSEAIYLNVEMQRKDWKTDLGTKVRQYGGFSGRLNGFTDEKIVSRDNEAISLEDYENNPKVYAEIKRVIEDVFLPIFSKIENMEDMRKHKEELHKVVFITQPI